MQNILKLMQIFYMYCSSEIKGDKQEYEFMNHNTHFFVFSMSSILCTLYVCMGSMHIRASRKFLWLPSCFLTQHSVQHCQDYLW